MQGGDDVRPNMTTVIAAPYTFWGSGATVVPSPQSVPQVAKEVDMKQPNQVPGIIHHEYESP